MINKYYLIVPIVAFFAGWFLKPEKTKTEIKTVEVIKEVKVKDEFTHQVITESPDGIRVIEIITESRTETNTDRITQNHETSEIVKPQWSIGIYKTMLGSNNSYLLTVDRRIIGNIFFGIYAQSDFLSNNQLGLGLRLEF